MYKGPKGLTPWVDLSSHQYPANVLLAGLGWAFTPKSPFEVPKKLQLFMLKGPRIKHIAKFFIGVPWVRNGQCKQFQAMGRARHYDIRPRTTVRVGLVVGGLQPDGYCARPNDKLPPSTQWEN